MVDARDQIQRFQEFLEASYLKKIHELVSSGKRSLYIEFPELAQQDPELAEQLLMEPEETIKASEVALQQFDLPKEEFRIRFLNLPNSQKVKIRDIRSTHLDNLIMIEGIVRQASDVRPQVISAKFECRSCGNLITVPQIESKFREPQRCSCGARGRFRVSEKILVDAQRLVIEESTDALQGGEQPKRLSVFVREDMVEPKMEKKTTPGSKVKVIGILKEVPLTAKSGGQLTRYDLALETNSIESVQQTYDDIDITQEDEQKIKELANDANVYQKLINSIAPSVYGHEEIKGALVLQLMGGVRKERSDGTSVRGDMHILLVGDPGAAKSTLLTFISKMAPRARYVAGRGASAAGITASVVKDEFMRGWALEAGAIVLANKGILCLHPDTEIVGDNKIVKIKELFDEEKKQLGMQAGEEIEYHNLNIKVPTFDTKAFQMKNGRATKIRRKKYKNKIMTLHFRSGFSLTLTPEHKLLNGSDVIWKPAQEFRIGDKVIAPLKLPEKKEQIVLFDILPDLWKVSLNKEEKDDIKKSLREKFTTLASCNKYFNLDRSYLSGNRQFTLKQLKTILSFLDKQQEWKHKTLNYSRKHRGERLEITTITPSLGYILGFLYGDGTVQISQRRTQIRMIQSLIHQSYSNQFTYHWKKVFGKDISYIKYLSKSIIRGKEVNSQCKIFYHGSNLLGNIYTFVTGNNLANLLLLDDETLKAFIAGVMDSDGCISTKTSEKTKKKYQVQHIDFMFDTVNKEANMNFILALRRLDCYGKLIRQNNYFLVELTGRTDVAALKKEIEKYSVKAKNKDILATRKNISSISQKIPGVPIAAIAKKIIDESNTSHLVKEGIWSTLYRYKRRLIEPSRDQMIKIMQKLILSSEMKRQIATIIARDYFIDEIVNIEEQVHEGYVYDIYVPETHNFVANGVIVHNCLDEMDKMSMEDTSALHEAMAQQQVTISKANIQATLSAQTTVLAAANPKLGRFDPFQPIAAQINLPPALINRFDLIFPVRDIPNKETDAKIASHILEGHATGIKEQEISTDILRKYIAYVHQHVFPKLSPGAIEEIKEFYVGLRNSANSSDQGGIKPIPISARQLEALVRLAEGSARVRLSNQVTKKDARNAIKILKFCMMQVGFDYETGQFDMDRIATGVPASTRNKILVIKEIIHELEARGKKTIPIEDIFAEAGEKNLTEPQVEEILEKLKKEGEIYEPKRGWISKL